VGQLTLQREADLVVPGLVLGTPVADYAEEFWRASRAARGYARHWLDDTVAALEGGAADPYGIARADQAWRLEMGAETEVSTAYNSQRERALQQFAWERPDVAVRYVRVWDSALEKNTCEVCAGAHGSWVPLGEDFPEGTPGQVHVRCQCSDHIEELDWVDPVMRAA
jgi:hypothetical protein